MVASLATAALAATGIDGMDGSCKEAEFHVPEFHVPEFHVPEFHVPERHGKGMEVQIDNADKSNLRCLPVSCAQQVASLATAALDDEECPSMQIS